MSAGPSAVVGASEPLSSSAGLAPDPPYRAPSLRSLLGLLALVVLLGGFVYPAAVTAFAQAVQPAAANGSLLYDANGTAIGSSLIGQNISSPSLFWLRPSLTDYEATTGSGESPYGPTDPALANLTWYYIREYDLNGTTVPLALVAPSESGIDPDVTPEAALVQIPRVAFFTNLSTSFLTGLVERHVQSPILGFLGPSYVNVIELDLDLLKALGR